ncbi:MAG: glycosyltransferase family 61 protein [Gammaproteobacteria bacterium]|nr:glycosyltransferase family 61 protein [Sideroxydans sp.]MBU3903132.1 glycosyltransferase family 61 protein [Gammaproteobacteria bacterium]MBU4044841.1 glycosyltransferase family 61 protein [Gammaproteobacteria bacterium]
MAGLLRLFLRFAGLLYRIAEHFVTQLTRSGWTRVALICLKGFHALAFRSGRTQALLTLNSVSQCARKYGVQVKQLLPERQFQLPAVPVLFESERKRSDALQHASLTLPAVCLYAFSNVEVIGGTELMIFAGKRAAYDELALGNSERYGCKAFGIIVSQGFGLHLPAIFNQQVLLSYTPNPTKDIDRGILLCKDHSPNYYHWLLECLPRAIVAMRESAYADYSLLVDEELPAQNFQALESIAGGRKIIKIRRRESFRVRALVFVDLFSHTHDNYGKRAYVDDLVIAPEAVALVRNAFLPEKAPSARKVFVARDGARYRRLLNETRLHALAVELGFEIVRPEGLSFAEQVAMFSRAECIVGPTGAGLTNMIFAPEGCRVLVLAGNTEGANFQIFGQLGYALGHDIKYLGGSAERKSMLHSDYTIDPGLFKTALASLAEAG